MIVVGFDEWDEEARRMGHLHSFPWCVAAQAGLTIHANRINIKERTIKIGENLIILDDRLATAGRWREAKVAVAFYGKDTSRSLLHPLL